MVCSKYNLNGGVWFPTLNQGKRVSKLWSDILAAAEQRPMLFNFFTSKVQISVGNGNRVRFWHDKWYGDGCFKEKFPRLFRLSTDRGSSLRSFVEKKGSTGV